MKGFLSKKEIAELKADHRSERELRFGDRIKAILMLNSGLPASKVAEYLLLDEKTVRSYRDRYLEGGLGELCVDWQQGTNGLLKLTDLDALEAELRSKIYLTTSAVVSYVKRTFGVCYSISGMTKLLKRQGFSYKKPQVVPGKANAVAQEAFLSMLSGLKEQKGDTDPILYLDGVHPQHNSHPAHGWLPKGEKIQLKSNTGRQRVTLSGALDAETHEILTQEDKILNADSTIKFLERIESNYPLARVIYLILDNAGYYRGKKIREYLENSKIELLYLPPYAPNLNLIERVWKFFKKKVLANTYYESFLEFREACNSFFRKKIWKSHKAELDTLLVDNFQITNA